MQKDVDRLMRKKRTRKRVLVITMIAMLASIVAISMRQCGEKVQESLNQKFRPLDDIRSDYKKYEKFKKSGL